jgi:antitoxin HigA-1
MIFTERKPASVGEILTEEFLFPLNLTQGKLADAMGVPRKHVNELCGGKRAVTVPTALILARVFNTSAEFWLNAQRRTDLWAVMHSPHESERIKRARPLITAT